MDEIRHTPENLERTEKNNATEKSRYLYNLIKYKRPELFSSYLKDTKDGF